MFPHQEPFCASQLDVAVGDDTEVLLLVLDGDVVDVAGLEVGTLVGLDDTGVAVVLLVDKEVTGFMIAVGVAEVAEAEEEESLKERYQLERSVSPKHSPTVTPFHPFCWIRP